jgi:hypothetical protein
MTWLRLKAAAVALTLGAAALAPGCAGGVYADSSGKTCIIVFVFPICN